MDMTTATAAILEASVGSQVAVNTHILVKNDDGSSEVIFGDKVRLITCEGLAGVADLLDINITRLRTPFAMSVGRNPREGGELFVFSKHDGVVKEDGFFDSIYNIGITAVPKSEKEQES
jgi:hypothetical protein